MASIYRSINIDVPSEFAWAAILDVGALHTRLVRGFVTSTMLSGLVREITFANGVSVSERILSIDEGNMRLAYTVVGGRASHHNAAVQVRPVGNSSCSVTWVTDLLPDELSASFGQMVDAGAAAMRLTLEEDFRSSSAA